MYSSGQQDVDVTLTTRELARMIKQAGIDLVNLPDEEADSPMGPYTGAGVIFGATGGVMEAALRTAYFLITGEELKDVNFTGVRGISGIKEARVHIKGTEVRVAVAHQMGNIAQVLDEVRKAKAEGKEAPWHFIEVMACRGGCIGGGGQPYGCTDEVRKQRMAGHLRRRRAAARTAARTTTPTSSRCTRSSSASPTATRPTSSCTPSTRSWNCTISEYVHSSRHIPAPCPEYAAQWLRPRTLSFAFI